MNQLRKQKKAQTQYKEIFDLEEPLPDRFIKVVFDKTVAFFSLLISTPIWAAIYLSNKIEGWIVPRNKGPLMSPYEGGTQGRRFLKYKFRIVKEGLIPVDQKLTQGHRSAGGLGFEDNRRALADTTVHAATVRGHIPRGGDAGAGRVRAVPPEDGETVEREAEVLPAGDGVARPWREIPGPMGTAVLQKDARIPEDRGPGAVLVGADRG